MRPIDADALYAPRSVRRVTEYDETGCGIDYLAVPWEVIEDAPTLDYAPVKLGEWVFDASTAQYGNPYRCSNCKEEQDDTHNFCPNCGAMMKEDGKDENA